ncbi:hypothetical protein PsorP6_001272 [Peronosclerospora sorghi]|uniref:Uncharacterized protein n=1 Tax=Peronosclerospora sorghi TaxID=230839 RepID=A0ACC0WY13_9STRA|nr:hypothetical protein PsorP6_001272 [Peronosclerospora sorghi]
MFSYRLMLAAQNIPYDTLMQDLGVLTVRKVEDILIDTIYSVRLTLISEIALLRCEYAVGHETHHEDVDDMIKNLSNWKTQSDEICEKINTILTSLSYIILSYGGLVEILHAADRLAEKEEENERTRKKNIRNNMTACAAERGKSFATVGGRFRQGNDFSQYADYGTRPGFV